MDITWLYAVLPWLALLACPFLMFWMMRGMRHGGGCGSQRPTDNARADTGADSRDETADEVAHLKARLERLEAQQRETKVES